MKLSVLAGALLLLPAVALAEVTAELSLVSEYLDNGVTNTDRKPALQGELSYEHESGAYLTGWASNVDYGGPEKLEVDVMLGYAFALNDDWALDVGASHFQYLGKSGATDSSYQDVFVGTTFKENTDFYAQFSPNYFGEDAYNIILTLEHRIDFDPYELSLKLVHNQSEDRDLVGWGDYQDFEVAVSREWVGLDFTLGGLVTTLDSPEADPRVFLSISKAWSW
ncbi:MAG: TorF family putative porin [Venatoribacter sp.]